MRHILTLNAGSSSIKFALFDIAAELRESARGQVEGLGAVPHLQASTPDQVPIDRKLSAMEGRDHASALAIVLESLEQAIGKIAVEAVGHRVVHGGVAYSESIVLDDEKIAQLERLNPLAPLHQPHNLSGIRAAQSAFPGAVQVGCFDTAFHRTQPWVDDTFALPRDLYDKGIRRYGFHGLSYEYVSGRLRQIAPHDAAGRVVVCHLGNGASMCAIKDGRGVGSTMGFTALDGLPMGTRCGQLDPGVVLYLMEQGMSVAEVEDLLYRRSGLKGLSELSQDMRELEAARTPEADDAIAYFVHRIRRELGGMAAMLSGLDALVFCAGIGENSSRVREEVCGDLTWLGIELDAARNRAHAAVISTDRSRVRVYVIHTDEEIMIARHTARLLGDVHNAAAA